MDPNQISKARTADLRQFLKELAQCDTSVLTDDEGEAFEELYEMVLDELFLRDGGGDARVAQALGAPEP